MSEPLNPPATGDAKDEAVSAKEAEDGKIFALLCYIIMIFSIVPIIQRDNAFSLYHAKQGLILLIAAIVGNIALTIVWIVLGIVGLDIVGTILSLAFMVAVIALIVIGAMNAWNGRQRPLPVIGPFGEKLFKGMKKK